MIKSMKSPRRLAAVAVFAIVAMSAFGFAATNTFPGGGAGDGAGDVAGSRSRASTACSRVPTLVGVRSNLQFTGNALALERPARPVPTLLWRRRPARSSGSALELQHDRCGIVDDEVAPGHDLERLRRLWAVDRGLAALAPPADTTQGVTL
ncbi:MAG: hypothetical protein IPF51_05865 [Dehalococcoidia bacterium]|uniref:hypothetical protein n=1 Tax=Candidatus Amarobacter glycogenicus TaxID=3140699 RepID=UPI003135E8D8|nr:hypothetical protein [Dehalococcoidia bacterium]